jgi:DNA-binding XRE family transcriptional regulator
MELNGDAFMERTPAGTFRDMKVYAKYTEEIRKAWDTIHRQKTMEAVLVNDAYRMMTIANPLEDSIEIGFVDGARGCIPYKDIPEIEERAGLSSLALPNPYEMVLETVGNEMVEIPWDFARHYCDAAYRPAIETIAMQGRQTLGERIRGFRKSAGLTQAALAQAANIGRVTLVRLEKGEQSPRFKTLDAIARALGRHATDLLVEPESVFPSATQYCGVTTKPSDPGTVKAEMAVNG